MVSDMSEHSREVMEKTFILATVINSDVYPISAVKMLKVAVEEITNKVVMFVTNIYYSYTGILLCTYNSNTVCKRINT
jgi:hypothetical protein